jgi:TPR repeat protein
MSYLNSVLLGLLVLVLPGLILVLAWSEGSRAALFGFLELSLRRAQARFRPRPALAWIAWARRAHRGSLARAFIAEAARTGDPEGLLEEGLLYWEGGWGAGGKEAAAVRFRQAAEAGLPEAMYWVAEGLRWGTGGAPDPEGALAWLRRGATAGSGACMAALAAALRMKGDLEAREEAARWEARLGATGADPQPRRSAAQGRAGDVEPDVLVRTMGQASEFATAWFERPGIRPLLPIIGWTAILLVAGTAATLLLLPFLFGGIFVVPMLVALAMLLPLAWRMRRDHRPGLAVRRHLDRARAGDPEAAYHMGMACLQGREGVPKDPAEARRWLGLAAQKGHLEAMVELSALLRWDLGGFKDPKGADAWLQRAAQAGHGGARARLAELDTTQEE